MYMGLFTNENSLFQRIFIFLGQLIALNLLWIVCSLPVITAGAATTSLFYCTLRMHKNGDCSVFKDFFRSFKQNFLQATAIWLILLLSAGCIYMERKAILTMPGMMPQIFSYIVTAICIPLILIALYVFPTLAAFENKISKLITNAFYFAVKKIFYALAVAAITIAPMYFTLVDAQLFPVYLLIWMMCGFSLTAYADAWFMWKLFRPYFSVEEEKGLEFGTDQYVF